MIGTTVTLSGGSIGELLKTGSTTEAVPVILQVLEVFPLRMSKFRLEVSDGHNNVQVVLHPKNNSLVIDQTLQKFCIIRCDRIVAELTELDATRRLIVLVDILVQHSGQEICQSLGLPLPYSYENQPMPINHLIDNEDEGSLGDLREKFQQLLSQSDTFVSDCEKVIEDQKMAVELLEHKLNTSNARIIELEKEIATKDSQVQILTSQQQDLTTRLASQREELAEKADVIESQSERLTQGGLAFQRQLEEISWYHRECERLSRLAAWK